MPLNRSHDDAAEFFISWKADVKLLAMLLVRSQADILIVLCLLGSKYAAGAMLLDRSQDDVPIVLHLHGSEHEAVAMLLDHSQDDVLTVFHLLWKQM